MYSAHEEKSCAVSGMSHKLHSSLVSHVDYIYWFIWSSKFIMRYAMDNNHNTNNSWNTQNNKQTNVNITMKINEGQCTLTTIENDRNVSWALCDESNIGVQKGHQVDHCIHKPKWSLTRSTSSAFLPTTGSPTALRKSFKTATVSLPSWREDVTTRKGVRKAPKTTGG